MLPDVFFTSACFFLWRKNVSPDTCAASVATQSTDGVTLVMRFCVQPLLNRGTTCPFSLNKPKTKQCRQQQIRPRCHDDERGDERVGDDADPSWVREQSDESHRRPQNEVDRQGTLTDTHTSNEKRKQGRHWTSHPRPLDAVDHKLSVMTNTFSGGLNTSETPADNAEILEQLRLDANKSAMSLSPSRCSRGPPTSRLASACQQSSAVESSQSSISFMNSVSSCEPPRLRWRR